MNNTESKLITAVLQDKQIHVLLQANVDNLLRTHGDIWNFVRLYFENNSSMPPVDLVREKFRDFDPVPGVGATKHHLEELQGEYLRDSLKDILRSAATDVQQGEGGKALEGLITKTSELKKNTAAIRDIDVTDLESAIAYFENVKKQQALGHVGIKTGLPGFDNYLPSGIMPGQLGVFLAYPGIGKSWLALYFAVQAWKQGRSPLVISLEMSETEVRNRVFTIMGEGRWSHRKLSNGEIELDMLKDWHEKNLQGKPEFHIISNDQGGEIHHEAVLIELRGPEPAGETTAVAVHEAAMAWMAPLPVAAGEAAERLRAGEGGAHSRGLTVVIRCCGRIRPDGWPLLAGIISAP